MQDGSTMTLGWKKMVFLKSWAVPKGIPEDGQKVFGSGN